VTVTTSSWLAVEAILPANLPARLGFRSGERGIHASRSIMLADLDQLLAATSVDATRDDYHAAIQEENVLGKGTAGPTQIEILGLHPHATRESRERVEPRFEAAVSTSAGNPCSSISPQTISRKMQRL
jgi:hypothetical protein